MTTLCPRPDKVAFKRRIVAQRHLRRWLGKQLVSLHVYRCECGRWHLGHKAGL